MKHLLIIFIFFAFGLTSLCQSLVPPGAGKIVNTAAGATSTNFVIDPDWKVTTMQAGAAWGAYPNIKGSSFYSEKWNKGYILLKNKLFAKNISLSFNVYDNQIYFLQDSHVLVLNESIPVAEFGLFDQEDSNKATIFRCGFPPVGRNTEQTYYKVISDHTIALLKHYTKSIVENTGTAEKTFLDDETWYVYNYADNKMTAIKKNKNSLTDALPQYAQLIEAITSQKNLKLKKENDWTVLFDELNKQIKE